MGNSLLLIIAILFVLIIGRFIYYQYKVTYLKRVKNLYGDYLKSYDPESQKVNPKLKEKLLKEKSELIKLFNKAEIPEASDSYMKPLGLGYAKQQKIRYLDNIHFPNENIISFFNNAFLEVIGYFLKRRNESFSPYYWLSLLINFPKHTFQFYGAKPQGVFYNLIDIIYKLAVISGFLYGVLTKLKIIRF